MPSALIIDRSETIDRLFEIQADWVFDRLPDRSWGSPYEVAHWASLSEHIPDMIAINAELSCTGLLLQEEPGIEILKFLRMMESFDGRRNQIRRCHCLIYSFRSISDLIRQNSTNLILAMPDVSFRRIPFDCADLFSSAYKRNLADIAEWRRAVRSSVRLPDERHDWANWYAAWQMLRIQNLHDGDTALSASMGASAPPTALVRDALFAYAYPDDLVNAASSKRSIATQLRNQTSERLGSESQVRKSIVVIDDYAETNDLQKDPGWLTVYKSVFGERVSIRSLMAEIKLEKSHLSVRSILNEFEKLNLADSACVLLDLRLLGERGRFANEELSGTHVLKWLRDKWPGLPVIVTTAARKAQTYEALMRVGADAYWIKLGLDDFTSGEDLASAHFELLRVVNVATGERYQSLRRLADLVLAIEKRQKQWWSGSTWFEDHSEKSRKRRSREIKRMLKDLLQMLRQYLHSHEMLYGYASGVSEQLWIYSIIQHAGKIIECVHGKDRNRTIPSRALIGSGFEKRNGVFVPGHSDWFATYLMDVRNSMSHYGSNVEITWAQLRTYLAHFGCYMLYGPQPEFDVGFKDATLGDGDKMVATSPRYRQECGRLLVRE